MLAAISGTPAALAAKGATTTIPIVFAVGGDPVAAGIVNNLTRPEGNVTGVSFYTAPVVAKRLELARELVLPGANIGLLVNPYNPPSATEGKAVEAAAAAIGQPFHIFNASTGSQIDDAFAAMASLSPRRGAILTTACIRAWQRGHATPCRLQFSPYTAAMPIRPYLDKYRFARTSYLSGAMLITDSIAWRS